MRHPFQLILLLPLCLAATVHSFAQQKEYDTEVSMLFQKPVKGKIEVNLHAPNPELITIKTTTTSKSKSKGSRTKTTATETGRFNIGIITYFTAEGRRYKFKRLKNNYGDTAIRNNCAVERIAGTDTLGIFRFVDEAGTTYHYIQTPNDGFEIYNISHPYVASSFEAFTLMRFIRCESLAEKISNHDAAFWYEEKNTAAEKLLVWQNIIREYYKTCKP